MKKSSRLGRTTESSKSTRCLPCRSKGLHRLRLSASTTIITRRCSRPFAPPLATKTMQRYPHHPCRQCSHLSGTNSTSSRWAKTSSTRATSSSSKCCHSPTTRVGASSQVARSIGQQASRARLEAATRLWRAIRAPKNFLISSSALCKDRQHSGSTSSLLCAKHFKTCSHSAQNSRARSISAPYTLDNNVSQEPSLRASFRWRLMLQMCHLPSRRHCSKMTCAKKLTRSVTSLLSIDTRLTWIKTSTSSLCLMGSGKRRKICWDKSSFARTKPLLLRKRLMSSAVNRKSKPMHF